MYIYEMMLLLIGIIIGMLIGWWIMKAEHLVRVGWAVMDWHGAILNIFVDREKADTFLHANEHAARLSPVHIKVFKDRDPAEAP